MEWFDERSTLEHPVIARLLLDASSEASFLSIEGQHNVGRTNKTFKNNVLVKDRKIHYLRNISVPTTVALA